MVDRLKMARQYVQEMLAKRDDIVGALVVGSVARGDADDNADIDLTLVVDREGEKDGQGGKMEAWREGVYIEAEIASIGVYADSAKVLADLFAAAYMNEGLILHDPSGTLARVQEHVRAVYMEPRRIGARVHPIVRLLRESLVGLTAAVAAGDLLGICPHVRRISFWIPSVPLLIRGITPSSTKALIQLGSVAPELRDAVLQWQGSTGLSKNDVVSRLPTISETLSVGGASYASQWGDFTRDLLRKAAWMLVNGWYREVNHLVWLYVCDLASHVRSSGDAQVTSGAEKLMQDWMRTVGWEGQDVLEGKVRMAEEMVAEVEAMAAHLPTGDPE